MRICPDIFCFLNDPGEHKHPKCLAASRLRYETERQEVLLSAGAFLAEPHRTGLGAEDRAHPLKSVMRSYRDARFSLKTAIDAELQTEGVILAGDKPISRLSSRNAFPNHARS